jgi:pimeloyl-ACP methyl ester carboxylesterase
MEGMYAAIPLVLIAGGGATIAGTYGRLLPFLAPGRRLIAVEGPERRIIGVERPAPDLMTEVVRREFILEEADAVAALLDYQRVAKADMMGFSRGGSVALQMAIRHPERVNRIIVISADHRRDGLSENELCAIRARAMILGSMQDTVKPEETVRMSRLIAGSWSIILPGRHGEMLGTEEAGVGLGYADVVAKLVDDFISSSFLRVDKSFALPYAVPLR